VLLFPVPEEGVDAGFTVGPFRDEHEANDYIERFRSATGRTSAYGEVMEGFSNPETLIEQLTKGGICARCGGPIKRAPGGDVAVWVHDNSSDWYAGQELTHDASIE
jgi:hypothetical protein